MENIPFNLPHLAGNELKYIEDAVRRRKLSGNGYYTQQVHAWFGREYGFPKTLLTTSCTDALEMAALLCNLQPGDEVIVPSYTFVSTANAFVLRGARLVFADSSPDNPNIDASTLESLITPRTKAIVPVHYGGHACDMDAILAIAARHNLLVVEDAAQAIDSYYNGKPLGSIGHFAAFSFHDTKNIISGEGGMLVVNHQPAIARAEIIWEKGTNRAAFYRGEVDKYTWVDVGSSFLPSEINAAFLFAQLEELKRIQARRVQIWNSYYQGLKPLADAGLLHLPVYLPYATQNGHLFYLLTQNIEERDALMAHLKSQGILAVFHYISLHASPFYKDLHGSRPLPHCARYSDTLLRLPLFCDLTDADVSRIVDAVTAFYKK